MQDELKLDALVRRFVHLIAIVLCFPSVIEAQTSGDRVRCNSNSVNVRSSTSTASSANVIGSVGTGDYGTIISGPHAGNGNTFTWFFVDWDNLAQNGYTASQFLVITPGPFTLSNDPAEWDGSLARAKVRLNWTTSKNASTYNIFRDGALYQSGLTAKTFTDSNNLVGEDAYFYQIQAVNANGTSVSNVILVAIPPKPTPTVTARSATNITHNSVTLNGRVDPNGFSTSSYFEYGTTTNYGTTTPILLVGAGSSDVDVSWDVSGLAPDTLFHYRAVGVNLFGGIGRGSDRTFRTLQTPKPDLVPYTQQGWSGPLVISTVRNTQTNAPIIYSTDTLFIDGAIFNEGTAPTNAIFNIQVRIDGASLLIAGSHTAIIPVHSGSQFLDFSFGPLSPGQHTLTLIADGPNSITELDETNNSYTTTITVVAPQPNLAHYQPDGWPDRMILSTTTGSHVSASSATTNDNLFVDLAFFNQGQTSTGPFHAQLKVDGVVASTMSFQSVPSGETRQILDQPLGKLSAGIHVVSLLLDSANEVAESIELADNYYEVPITITGPVGPNVTITGPSASSTWHVGETIPVSWTLGGTTAGVTGFRVSFLMNGVIFDSTTKSASTRSLNWTVPSGFVTSAGSIKVEALGPVGDFDQVAISTASAQPATLYPIIIISHASPVPLNSAVQFSAANSLGPISKYSWRFSDGTVLDEAPPVVSHVFRTAQNGKGWVELFLNGLNGPYKASVAFALSGSATDPNTGQSKDPVGTATGNFFLGLDLMPVRGRGLDFLFQAYYSSMSYRPPTAGFAASPPGALGFGWTHTFEARIETATEDDVRTALVSFGDGHAEKYLRNPTLSPTEQWRPQTGTYNRLREESDGSFTLQTRSDINHEFDSAGRLRAISDRNGNRLNVIWESFTGQGGADEKRIQKVILPGGPGDGSLVRQVLFHYRPESPGFLWKLEDPMEQPIVFNQDVNGDLTSWTNERGNSTVYTYDASHQLLTGTDGEGNRFVRNLYNPDTRRVDRQEDASGNVTLFEYLFPPPDTLLNRLTRITRLAAPTLLPGDPSNEVTEDVHDPRLRLLERRLKVEDQDHVGAFVWLIERREYDPATGDLITYTNRRGYETKYTHVAGNLARKEELGGPIPLVTTYDYTDSRNPTLPTLITYPDPLVKKRLEYDAKGNLLFSTFPYDPAHPLDNRRASVPDAYGQILSVTDANGLPQAFEFDDWGRKRKWIDGDGKPHLFEFDDNGRKTAEINPRGHRITFVRNVVGKIWKTVQADPNDPANPVITEVEFDNNEMQISSLDPLSHFSRSHRDEQGRIWKEENHELHAAIHRFDAFGREFETENAKGGIVRRFFNFAGHLMSEASPAPSTNVIRYRRDENGNATETIDGDGVRTTTLFDFKDRPVITRRWKSATEFDEIRTSYNVMDQKEWIEEVGDDGVPRRTSFDYDLAGNHVRTVPASGPEHTFGYDREGHQTSATHDGDKTRRDIYTNRYQLKERTDENGHAESFFYDDAGNLERHINADLQEITFVHDALNRLTRINPPTGPPIIFVYDKANRRIEMADSTGTTKWTYSTLDQVASIEMPGGLKLAFHYDPIGATDSVTYPGNRVANYQIDNAGRFQSVTDWANRTISQTYTVGNRPLRLQFPNGVHSDLGYDAEGRLNNIIHQKDAEPTLLRLGYEFNSLGKVKTLPDIQLTEPEGEYPRTYGDANELLTIAGSPVLHDNRGNITNAKLNPTSPVTDSLAWDYANHLTGGTIGGLPFSNTFNGLGHRVSTTRNSVATRFLTDDRPIMPRIMGETDAVGVATAFYLYAGNALLARLLPDGTPSYYHTDRQGNVVLLSDGTGSIAALYQYDPFGVPTSSSGPLAALNRFRFLGGFGVWDNNDGTLHARTRTYHPLLGRFLSRDRLYGRGQDGQSLNRYVYCLNDPCGFGDPSGMAPVRPVIYSAPPEFNFWKTFSKDLLVRFTYIGVGLLPGVGIGMDVETLADPNAGPVSKALAGLSITAAGLTEDISPNFGPLRKAFSRDVDELPLIYRGGSKTDRNLTPKIKDTDGLSASRIPFGDKSQVINPNLFKNLEAIMDGENHVTIRPKDIGRLQEWIDARLSGATHEFTEEVRSSIIDTILK